MEYYDSEANDVDVSDAFDDYFEEDDRIKNPSNKMVKLIKEEGPEMQYLSELPSHLGRYIAIDAEFTGLDEKEDQLLELAACEIKDCKLTWKKFHCYIKPRGEIKGTEFHGITKETYEKLPEGLILDDKKNLEDFLNFVGDSLIFAHNPIKDIAFINKELSLNGLKPLENNQFRCTMRLYYKRFCNTYIKKINLESCCKTFNIKCFGNHSAVEDCENTGKLLIYLIRKKKNNKKKK